MAMLKIQTWQPDTHPGHSIEVEWEYDIVAGRDTGREHRGVSVTYPDGTCSHRDTHGPDVAHQHYRKLLAEHIVKNQAYGLIVQCLPDRMKKPVIDSDGDKVLDEAGKQKLVVKDKHRPTFKHLGESRYAFSVPGIDQATQNELARKLAENFGDAVVLVKSD